VGSEGQSNADDWDACIRPGPPATTLGLRKPDSGGGGGGGPVGPTPALPSAPAARPLRRPGRPAQQAEEKRESSSTSKAALRRATAGPLDTDLKWGTGTANVTGQAKNCSDLPTPCHARASRAERASEHRPRALAHRTNTSTDARRRRDRRIAPSKRACADPQPRRAEIVQRGRELEATNDLRYGPKAGCLNRRVRVSRARTMSIDRVNRRSCNR
jgi:hypothetical protein